MPLKELDKLESEVRNLLEEKNDTKTISVDRLLRGTLGMKSRDALPVLSILFHLGWTREAESHWMQSREVCRAEARKTLKEWK